MQRTLYWILFMIPSLSLFGQTISEGTAVVGTRGRFPQQGSHVFSREYFPGTRLLLQNVEGTRNVQVEVLEGEVSGGFLLVLAPEVARGLGINTAGVVRIQKMDMFFDVAENDSSNIRIEDPLSEEVVIPPLPSSSFPEEEPVVSSLPSFPEEEPVVSSLPSFPEEEPVVSPLPSFPEEEPVVSFPSSFPEEEPVVSSLPSLPEERSVSPLPEESWEEEREPESGGNPPEAITEGNISLIIPSAESIDAEVSNAPPDALESEGKPLLPDPKGAAVAVLPSSENVLPEVAESEEELLLPELKETEIITFPSSENVPPEVAESEEELLLPELKETEITTFPSSENVPPEVAESEEELLLPELKETEITSFPSSQKTPSEVTEGEEASPLLFPPASLPLISTDQYYVQVAVLSNESNAQNLADKFLFPSITFPIQSQSKRLFAILVGPIQSDERGITLLKMREQGYTDAFIRSGKDLSVIQQIKD